MPNRTVHSCAMLLALAGSSRVLYADSFPAQLPLSSLDGTTGFVINGIDAGDAAGKSVAIIGDVNGDGVDDLLIGAYMADNGSANSAGEAYVVFGGAGVGASGSFNLSTLDGSNGFIIRGRHSFDRCGWSGASAGDINHDGIADLIVGAIGGGTAGTSYVVFGRNTAVDGQFDASYNGWELDGVDGFSINGEFFDDYSGSSVASAGDFNGDGIDDLVIGAFHASLGIRTYEGVCYVFYGKDTAVDGPFPADVSLPSLTGPTGFKLNGIGSYDWTGYDASGAGDLNGDGFDDIIVNARMQWSSGATYPAGRAYVVFGGPDVAPTGSLDLSALDGTNGFTITPAVSNENIGYSVSEAGDVNGDGIADVIIGSSLGPLGKVYVLFGKNTSTDGPFTTPIPVASIDGTNGFSIGGLGAVGFSTVSGAGDINHDGIDDVIVGTPSRAQGFQQNIGGAYVVFGKDTAVDGLFPATVSVALLDGANGFAMPGIGAGDKAGGQVAGGGDVNADGIDDVIIGARGGDPNANADAGECYIVFGRAPDPCAGDVTGDGITNAADFTMLAGSFGSAVPPNTSGDLNGDGLVNAADFTILAGDFGCGTP